MAAEAIQRRTVWLARLGAGFLRLLGATWRVRYVHADVVQRLRASRTPIVFVLWHGELLPLLYAHRRRGVAVLISEHADGELIAQVAVRLGFTTVRGSTSRGAARALIGLTRAVERGADLAITPDGPRGPARSVAPGALVVAHRTGSPLIAATARASSSWRLGSWDRFVVPKPFAKIDVGYSDPIYIDAANAHDAASQVSRVEEAFALAAERTGG